MIVKYYQESDIRNDSERRFSECIDLSLRYDPDNEWHILYSYKLGSHQFQKEGECDFVTISPHGVAVVECKGGVIRREGGKFQRRKRYKDIWESIDNPFEQLDGNEGTLEKVLKKKKIRDTFVSGFVFFPDCSVDYSGDEWQRGVKFIDRANQEDILEVMLHSFQEQKKKAGNPWIDLPRLSPGKIESIANQLSPNINPDIIRDTLNFGVKRVAQLKEIQQSIFEGLSENDRLMIEGPPGSGKSRAARDYILEQEREGKKGLYVCWNLLLLCEIQQWAKINGLTLEVWSYYDLVKRLMSLAGLNPDVLTYENYREKIIPFLRSAFDTLDARIDLPQYDYLIVDEAQDVFPLGLGVLIENILSSGNGLQNGSYWLLYDDLQGYNKADFETSELLKLYAAHFRLKNRFRAAGNKGILELITDIDTGIFNANKIYGNSVSISEFSDEKHVLKHIKSIWNTERVKRNYKADDSILLFASDLLDPENKKGRVFDHLTESCDFAHLLTKENFGQTEADKIPFTTILRFKGLERNIVFIVLRDPLKAKENVPTIHRSEQGNK